MSIIDLSLTIDNGCMTCGTPWHEKVSIEPLGTIASVGRNTSRIVLGSHTATHMDAPVHFISNGKGIESVLLKQCIGDVTCVDLRHIGEGQIVNTSDLTDVSVTERMLFIFSWYKKWKTDKYYCCFPFFSYDAIRHLVKGGMRLMAMDTPSPDDGNAITSKRDSPNHRLLLAKDIIIIEYLTNTDEIDLEKKYEIIALPLKIAGIDGSPARVILREVYNE